MIESPPPVPPESSYTSYWCEENIYLLCQKFLADPSISKEWTPWVVFISNLKKTVSLSGAGKSTNLNETKAFL
jgi:hypothetical protein